MVKKKALDLSSPDSWKEAERIVKAAARQYDKHRVPFEKLARGKFIVIATDDPDVFEIHQNEMEAEKLFRQNHGDRLCASFRIGFVV